MFNYYPPFYGYRPPQPHPQVQTLWTPNFPPPPTPADTAHAWWAAQGRQCGPYGPYNDPYGYYRCHNYHRGSRMPSYPRQSSADRSRKRAEIRDMEGRIEALRAGLRKKGYDYEYGYGPYDLSGVRSIDSLQDVVTLRRQLDDARRELDCNLLNYQTQASVQEEEIQELRAKLRRLESKETANRIFDDVYGGVAAHHAETPKDLDISGFEAVLKPFADRCHDVAIQHYADIGPILVVDSPIPQLPRSLSKYAQLMRCATIETIIAKALLTHVFVGEYTAQPDGEYAHGYRHGHGSFGHQYRHHHSYRYGFGAATYAAIVENAVDDVLRTLNASQAPPPGAAPRLHDGGLHRSGTSAFVDDIRELFREGIDIWAPVYIKAAQAGRRLRASLSSTPGRWESDEDMRPIYGARSRYERPHDHGRLSSASPVVVPLFPQIYLQKDPPSSTSDGDSGTTSTTTTSSTGYEYDLVFHGFALWSDQLSFVLARQEEKEQSRRLRLGRYRRRTGPSADAYYHYYGDGGGDQDSLQSLEDEAVEPGRVYDYGYDERDDNDDHDNHDRSRSYPSNMATSGSTYLDDDTSSISTVTGRDNVAYYY